MYAVSGWESLQPIQSRAEGMVGEGRGVRSRGVGMGEERGVGRVWGLWRNKREAHALHNLSGNKTRKHREGRGRGGK